MNFYLAVLIGAAITFFGATALANYKDIDTQASTAQYTAPPLDPAMLVDAQTQAQAQAGAELAAPPSFSGAQCSNVLTNLPFELAKRIGLAWCSFSAYLQTMIARWGLDPFNAVLAVAIILGALVAADHLNIHLSGGIAGYALLIAFFIILLVVIGGL